MTKSMAIGLAVAGLLAFAGAAQAALLLDITGLAPGPDPGNGAMDVSGTNSPLSVAATGASWDAGEQAWYVPTPTAHLATVGADEANFDFPWDQKFTLVMYFKPAHEGNHQDLGLFSKTDPGINQGYGAGVTNITAGQTVTSIFMIAEGNCDPGCRTFSRKIGPSTPVTPVTDNYHLMIYSADGTAHGSNDMQQFYNGVEQGPANQYGLGDTGGIGKNILNNEPLALGWDMFGGNGQFGLTGHIKWAQVWDTDMPMGMTAQQFATWVWNDGDVRVTPEPATMALLGIGGLMVLRRRRSA